MHDLALDARDREHEKKTHPERDRSLRGAERARAPRGDLRPDDAEVQGQVWETTGASGLLTSERLRGVVGADGADGARRAG